MLGIDPGTVALGWGLVVEAGGRLQHEAHGVVRCRGDLPHRLAHLFEGVSRLLEEHEPGCLILEKSFVGENVQSAFRLGEARGAVLVAAARAGVAVHEYSPAEIKVAVVGNGRAGKEQVQFMVQRLLDLDVPPATDAADALGAAICHLHRARFEARVGMAGGRR